MKFSLQLLYNSGQFVIYVLLNIILMSTCIGKPIVNCYPKQSQGEKKKVGETWLMEDIGWGCASFSPIFVKVFNSTLIQI